MKKCMTNAEELFSVILLVYNNAHLLYGAIDSVLMQNYSAIELIVVDDGSDTFPKEQIHEYIKNHSKGNLCQFTVYRNPKNLGTVRSANGALHYAKGVYIKLLAADDAMHDTDTLCHAAEVLKQHPDSIVLGKVTKCDSAMRPLGDYHKSLMNKINELSSRELFRRLCVHNDILAGSVFFHRSFFETYGYFDENYRLLEDWPTWLRAAQKGVHFFYAPFYAINYRANEGIGGSINNFYLQDKKRVLEEIIIPARQELGYWYVLARLCYWFINSQLVRRAYGLIFR